MTTAEMRSLTIDEIMTREPLTVTPSDTLAEVARVLDANEISAVPVVDGNQRVLGVVSKTDVLHRAVAGPPASPPVSFIEVIDGFGGSTDLDPAEFGLAEEFMSTEFLRISPGDRVSKVARQMADGRFHRAIVVDSECHLLGIVTSLDILCVFPQ